MKWIIAILGMLVTAAALSGCGGGGGGGGGGSSSGSGSFTLSGTVINSEDQNSSTNGVSGATVTLDDSYTSNVTGSNGAWTISNIPAIVDANNGEHKLDVEYGGEEYDYDLPAFSGTTDSGIELEVNTPPPPPSVVPRPAM